MFASHRHSATVLVVIMIAMNRLGAVAANDDTDIASDSRARLTQYFQHYCTDCHGADEQMAGVVLNDVPSPDAMLSDRDHWLRVLQMVKVGAMPPEDVDPRPGADECSAVADLLHQALFDFDCDRFARPGPPVLRRLNRSEYNNTIRDLFHIDLRPADQFPADDVGEGFDNIGGLLSVSPLLMEKYLAAAERVSSAVLNPESEQRAGIIVATPDESTSLADAARQVLAPLLRRAFRRPVRPDEIDRYVRLIETTAAEPEHTWDSAVGMALRAILVAPELLFRIESSPAEGESVRSLDDHEVAVRLSYFLWSSMPDDVLFELADDGRLREPSVLREQIRRMLHDDRSQALFDNFAAQWLNLRNLALVRPDPKKFGDFDNELRDAMLQETSRVFRTIVREDRAVDDLLRADFTWLNQRLANHYGIEGVEGEEFQRVSLTDTPRRGVLTHGSVLTLTSYPGRTSPVQRGKWILENILGDAPPPPPPGVPELEAAKVAQGATLREKMEQHRQNTICASCHQVMDPLGLGLENFDAIGRWRDTTDEEPVDASGVLPSGEEFRGATELVEILIARRADFERTLAEKMLIYATGRGLQYYDQCTVSDCVQQLAHNEHRFSVLVEGIVLSDTFLKCRLDELLPDE